MTALPDAVLAALAAAPADDEPETAADRAMIEEARREIEADDVIHHEVIRARWDEPSKCPVCKGSKCASCDHTGLALCHCNEPCWRDTHLCEWHYKQMLARWNVYERE